MADRYSKEYEKFLSTPSHGGRHGAKKCSKDYEVFLSTPSHGGRRYPVSFSPCKLPYFYPRPHMEGDKDLIGRFHQGNYFYPRPHMEGDIRLFIDRRILMTFLSTPSHGGRLLPSFTHNSIKLISIHALTCRATPYANQLNSIA